MSQGAILLSCPCASRDCGWILLVCFGVDTKKKHRGLQDVVIVVLRLSDTRRHMLLVTEGPVGGPAGAAIDWPDPVGAGTEG